MVLSKGQKIRLNRNGFIGYLVSNSVVESDVIDHSSNDRTRVSASFDAPRNLRAPMADPFPGFDLSFGAGRDGLSFHHVSGVAVELHHVSDCHLSVRTDDSVFRSRDFVAHDWTTCRNRTLVAAGRWCFVNRPLASFTTSCLKLFFQNYYMAE